MDEFASIFGAVDSLGRESKHEPVTHGTQKRFPITRAPISLPVRGDSGSMLHFWCPAPVQVGTNTQAYRETYRESVLNGFFLPFMTPP